MIVLSDLHGNLDALETILAEADEDRSVLCLGDVLGREGDNDECVRRLHAHGSSLCVIGNHEERALEDGNAAVPFNGRLSGETLRRLEHWSRVVSTARWTAFHATPGDAWVYLFEREDVVEVLREVSTPIVFAGHTHRPMWFCGETVDDLDTRSLEPETHQAFDPDARHFLNPGSASQPLATDLPPTYLEIDWEERTLCWHTLPAHARSRPGFN